MADMVGTGVMEGLQPDTRHGVEAQLALENKAGIPNVVDHRLDLTQEQPHSHTKTDTHAHPHLVNDQAQQDASQPLPLMEPTVVDPAEADVLHHHDAHHAVDGAANHLGDHVVHGGHQAHTGQPGQEIHDNVPGSADPAVGVQLDADTRVIESTLPDSTDMLSGLNHEKHHEQADVRDGQEHLGDGLELGAAHDGVYGSHGAILPQTAGYGGVLSQLLSFGVPVACVFLAVAAVLWKRLGPPMPLTSGVW